MVQHGSSAKPLLFANLTLPGLVHPTTVALSLQLGPHPAPALPFPAAIQPLSSVLLLSTCTSLHSQLPSL